jgi:thiamine biosynthesis lipoprotein
MRRKRRLVGGMLACLFLSGTSAAGEGWQVRRAAKMGTRIEVRIWHEKGDQSARLLERAMSEVDRIEADMSTYRESSMLSAVNRLAAHRPMPVSNELFTLLGRSLSLSERTAGAFDITYDSVGYLYDFRASQRPGSSDILDRLDGIDYRHVLLDPVASTVAFARDDVRVNLGGIAKGYAVERVVMQLRAGGVKHAMVTAGGDTRLLGDRRGRPWIVGIRDPDDDTGVMTRVPLADEAISTSGDYERFFEENGVRYHHILDPADGRPAGALRSVTVIGPDATMTDGLSTSLFVLGIEKGLSLIESLPEYDAVLIDPDRRIHFSSGLGAD